MSLKACDSIATIEFNSRDPSVLMGGLTNGLVCVWDVRTGQLPVSTSHRKYSHR